MALPKEAEAPEQLGSDGNFSLITALALDDADHEALAVDVFGLDCQRFAHAQTALIDDGEVSAVAAIAESAE